MHVSSLPLAVATKNHAVPADVRKEMPTDVAPPILRTRPSMLATALCHGIKDTIGQMTGRTVGLAIFSGISSQVWQYGNAKIIAGGLGALAAGSQALLLGASQIGTESIAQKSAIGLCTVASAAAGATVAALGSLQPVTVLAIAAVATCAVSVLRLYAQGDEEDQGETLGETADAAKAMTFFMVTAASLTAVAVLDHAWGGADDSLAMRSIARLAEATCIELFKSSFETLGPSANRNALNFNGKALASACGLFPYWGATVVLNGVVSGRMQPPHTDSHEFLVLWGPLIIGSLANGIRGATNSAVVQLIHQARPDLRKEATEVVRPSMGLQLPGKNKVPQKIIVRFVGNICTNALYFKLRAHGMSVLTSATTTQVLNGVIGQGRDLIFELMQGEGWNEPRLKNREAAQPSA